jgi:putative sugar O-methyltransferase
MTNEVDYTKEIDVSCMDAVLRESYENYLYMKKLYAETGYDKRYKLSTFWANENQKAIHEAISTSTTAEEAIHAIQRTPLYCINPEDEIKQRATDWLLERQRRVGIHLDQLDPAIQESQFTNPDTFVQRFDRNITPDFLRCISITEEVRNVCEIPEGGMKVLELGAGVGHLARLLRIRGMSRSHVITDLPETMLFSFMYLKLNYPEAKTLYVTKEEDITETMNEDYDFVFVPTYFADHLARCKFDFFVNTASLGEMRNEVIRYWMDLLQNKWNVRYACTLNRYLNTVPLDGRIDSRLEENECSLHWDSDWKMLRWELEPLFTRCPYVDTLIARYIILIAERDPGRSQEEKGCRAKELLDEVKLHDWYRQASVNHAEATARENIMANDLTMDGALFKLWEAVRLDPNEDNVATLLIYLEQLMHRSDREFEEVFFYERFFDILHETEDDPMLDMVKFVIDHKRLLRKTNGGDLMSYQALLAHDCTAPALVDSDFHRYSIVAHAGFVYALSYDLGSVDVHTLFGKDLSEYEEKGLIFTALTIDGAKRLVEDHIAQPPSSAETSAPVEEAQPETVQEESPLVSQAMELWASGEQDGALKLLEDAVDGGTEAPDVLCLLGDLFLQTDQTDRAISEYKKLVAADPLKATGYTRLARLYIRAGDLKEAQRLLQTAMSTNPEDPDVHTQTAVLFWKQGDMEKVQEYLGFALQIDPLDADAIGYTARMTEELGDLDGAADILRQYLTRIPNPLLQQELDRVTVLLHEKDGGKDRALMLCCAPPERVGEYVVNLADDHALTFLVPASQADAHEGLPAIILHNQAGVAEESFDITTINETQLQTLKGRGFKTVFIAYDERMVWGTGFLPERLASAICPRVVLLFANGEERVYEGDDDMNRICYNRAYMDTMFRFAPPLKGKRALEIGCSDGLACDMLLSDAPERIEGIDILDKIGERFPDPRIGYHNMLAEKLDFPDDHFDLVFSIAVMEHIKKPRLVLEEILRVTKPGGTIYVQAGPLYFSPFGPHMFGHFDDIPWIHLRHTSEEIVQIAEQRGLADRIETDEAGIAGYIKGMMSYDHVNHLRLPEYELAEFVRDHDLDVLYFNKSTEGNNLLTPELEAELAAKGYDKDTILTHGFEMVLRKAKAPNANRTWNIIADDINGLLPLGPPELVGSAGVYNMVAYAGYLFGLPLALGECRIEEASERQRPGIIRTRIPETTDGLDQAVQAMRKAIEA